MNIVRSRTFALALSFAVVLFAGSWSSVWAHPLNGSMLFQSQGEQKGNNQVGEQEENNQVGEHSDANDAGDHAEANEAGEHGQTNQAGEQGESDRGGEQGGANQVDQDRADDQQQDMQSSSSDR